MATHRIPILGWNSAPDTSGNVFITPYDSLATNKTWKHMVWSFADSATRDLLYGKFVVPKNYVGSPVFVVVWTTTATTGNAIWDLDYRTVGGNDTTSLDQSTAEETLTVTDAAPGAAHRRLEATMSATAGNFSADEEVEFLFGRDGASSDTIAATIMCFSLLFEYADA